ncbi:MAG: VanZ family protein [Bacilli bacterium]|nr:VanZ family protein [Bacilli bacterium]
MIEPLYNNFKDLLLLTSPIVFVSLIIIISFRLSYLYKNKIRIVLYKEIILFFFSFYALCLFQIVTSQDTQIGGSNFVPFKEIMRYELFSRLFIKNVIGNVLLFLPYGFFAGKYFSGKNKTITFFLILLASLSIEFTQLYIGRVFDVDDIILNVLGGMIGYLVYLFLEKIINFIPKALKSEKVLNIIFTGLLIIFLVVIVFLLI